MIHLELRPQGGTPALEQPVPARYNFLSDARDATAMSRPCHAGGEFVRRRRAEDCHIVERLLLAAETDSTWVWSLLGILSIPALVALNAFFVAAEFSLVAVRKTRVEELLAQGAKGAGSAAAAIKHLNRTIAATQLGITLASIGLGWVAERAVADLFVELFAGLPAPWN